MKKNILIYDDDEEILLLCKAILTKNGFVVDTLSICENVISDIQAFKPDVILMDLWIPVMGGEKAIEVIKNNEATKNIPVLIFSANADIKEIYKKVNAEGYIKKPFSISTFIETIKRHAGWKVWWNKGTNSLFYWGGLHYKYFRSQLTFYLYKNITLLPFAFKYGI